MKRQRHGDPTQGDKGKKRKRKDESDGIATKELPRNVSTPQKVASGTHAEPAEVLSGFERMDEETTTYLNEVKAHLDTLVDMEEISLLVGNALEELEGRELKAATDAACSRILEALIAHAAPGAFLGLMNALTDGQEWCKLSARPFGSRVAEILLKRLEALLEEGSDEGAAQALQQVLAKTTDVTMEHLYEFATDRNASHVARRLLCVIAGRDVMPAQHNSSSMDASAIKANKGKGLAAKLESQLPAQGQLARHPQLLQKLATALMQPKWDAQKDELLFHAYACPWLQALLKACAGEQDILAWLVPRLLGAKPQGDTVEERKAAAQSDGLSGIAKEHVQGLLQDRTASHLLEVRSLWPLGRPVSPGWKRNAFISRQGGVVKDDEVVMQTVPEWLLEQLYSSFLRGSLANLAMHPLGNFGVQAYLSALQTPQQLRSALRELRDSFTQLLRGRRAGVPAALLAAAARAGNAALQVDAAKALLTATAVLQTGTSGQGPAAVLLTLDCVARLGEQAGKARLSTLGAAMLSTLMRCDKEASAAFAESIAGLAPAELLHMGMDSAGSRSLEAFLDSGVSAKAKKRVIRKLASSYARLGNSPGGSHVAQACYRTAGVKDKEVIAVELAAAEQHLSATGFGQMLLRRCAIEEFKRSSDSWRSHAKTAAALRSDFAELLSDAEQPAQPDRVAQSAAQHNASTVPKLPAASKGKAKGSKPRKSEKDLSVQPLEHDVSEEQRDKGAKAAGGTGLSKKRRKGIGPPAPGHASAAAEVQAEHAGSAAQVRHTLPKADSAAVTPGTMTHTDSKPKRRRMKGSAGCPSKGNTPAAEDERADKKEERKVDPAGLSPESTADRVEQRQRQNSSAQPVVKTEDAGKKKGARKQKPNGLWQQICQAEME